MAPHRPPRHGSTPPAATWLHNARRDMAPLGELREHGGDEPAGGAHRLDLVVASQLDHALIVAEAGGVVGRGSAGDENGRKVARCTQSATGAQAGRRGPRAGEKRKMDRNPAALTAGQVAVLRWIADGYPQGEGESIRRISARALHRRGLVRVRRSGRTWTAAITPAGRAWLDAHPADAAVPTDGPEALVRRVVDAGGCLDVGESAEAKVRYEAPVRASLHSPNRPKGWRLELKNVGNWSSPRYRVMLVRYFDDLVDLIPVAVPSRVAGYHPAVTRFLADKDRQMVSPAHLDRAARLLQALADEAPRRGIAAHAPGGAPRPVDTYYARRIERAHLVLEAPAGTYGVRIKEQSAPGGRSIERRPYSRQSRRPAWLDSRDREFVSTGVLELLVEGPGMAYNGNRLADSKTATLEAKLPRVFRAIEIERLKAEERQREREREAADRRHRWEAAMAEARRRFDEQARWDDFARRSRDWEAARCHRQFLAAARDAAAGLEPAQRASVEAHLDYAERRLADLDPLTRPETLVPSVPEPAPEDLKRHLGTWSPSGPEAGGW
jgi:hypothetical protein